MGETTIFTKDNTEGFDQKTLNEMNEELETLMADVNKDSLDYYELEQRASESILKKYGGA